MEHAELSHDNVSKTMFEQFVNIAERLIVMAERSGYKLDEFRQALVSSHIGTRKEIPS